MINLSYSFRLNSQATALPFFLCTVGVNTTQYAIRRPDGIEHHQLLFCRDGRGYMQLNGKPRTLLRGDIYYLPPRIPHEYSPDDSGSWRTDWISFSGSAVAELLPSEPGVWHSGDLNPYFELLTRMNQNDLMLDYSANSVLLYQLLLRFREETLCEKGINVSRTRERLQPVFAYMQAHYADPVTIRELAAQLSVSDEQFCRIFHSVCHTRPMAYLNFLRVSNAKKLMLTRPELSIKTIASMVGFGNSSYFGRIFQRTEGISANAWRNQHELVFSEKN